MAHEPLDLSLTLFTAPTNDDTSFFNHRLVNFFDTKEEEEDGQRQEEEEARIGEFRYYTAQEEEEERRKGVSTRLTLYDDPWKIKKVLQQSDVNNLCRLMIPKRLVHQHIIPEWRRSGKHEDIRDLENNREIQVKVWDFDRRQEYVLTLRKHRSNDCYVFRQNWSRQFVVERGLKKGDNIGMFWCCSRSRFNFMVLDHAHS